MIETSSIRELFEYFVRDMRSTKHRLVTSNAELRELLAQLRNVPETSNVISIQLEFTLQEFESTLKNLGRGAEFMWPGTTTEAAGLRLLLTHIDEQAAEGGMDGGDKRMSLPDSEPLLTTA